MKRWARRFLLISMMLFILPCAEAKGPLTLSLQEAIFLAVRSNPNVQVSKLNFEAQKFNLYVEKWQFAPHYSFQASAIAGNGTNNQNSLTVQPGISLLTPIGTQLTFTSNNQIGQQSNLGLSLQVMQPLMRGFGRAIVETALNNAKDSEVIARLNVEGTLRNTVSAVINAYLDVVSASRTIKIDEDAVKRAEQSVEQTKLFIQAGHKAGNELITVQANVAMAKTQLENDKNALQQAQYALLTAIGVDPNTEVKFTSLNVPVLISKYHLPLLSRVKQLTLDNDIQYQTDQITLHGSTKRSVLIAEDNSRWQLNLTATANVGNNGQGGVLNVFNPEYRNESVGLSLQIPINDQLSKQAVMNAKIALKEAELGLMQEKWNKETSAINGWNLVNSADHALRYANDAEELQEKTYQVSYQKYLHGLIDSLALQSAQLQLIQTQQTLLSAQISYIKALVNLDLLTGNTLRTWDILVRV